MMALFAGADGGALWGEGVDVFGDELFGLWGAFGEGGDPEADDA